MVKADPVIANVNSAMYISVHTARAILATSANDVKARPSRAGAVDQRPTCFATACKLEVTAICSMHVAMGDQRPTYLQHHAS